MLKNSPNSPIPFFIAIIAVLFLSADSFGQTATDDLIREIQWREIGPANPGGRVVDVEGFEKFPKIIYMGAASGGVWKTSNSGITWEPIFESQPVGSIGDIGVYAKDPNIVYVGTGEANNRNSSPWGKGVFKTIDGGKTWEHIGLEDTHHIGRVIVDPKDPDLVYVAAAGHLWGTNEERGVFKTTDGGKSWTKVLYIDDKTGVIDIAMHPKKTQVLYAAAYERQRDGFSGGDPAIKWGPGSGIYVSNNRGKSWKKMSKGLPTVNMGRIGLAVSGKKRNHVYAIIETSPMDSTQRANMSDEEKAINRGGIFKSTNNGKSWKKTGSYNNRPFYYSQIRVDPNDDDTIWMGGVNLMYSEDGGKTTVNKRGSVHVDIHGIWIDPNDSDHVIIGSDGGVAITLDRGKYWDHNFQMSLGQFYAITADMQKPYYVYGGLQDNDSWAGASKTRSIWGIRNRDWFSTGGADGFFSQVDPTDHKIVYSSSQNGRIRRVDMNTGRAKGIQPDTSNTANFREYYPEWEAPKSTNPGGFRRTASPFRFDWNSPLLLSAHNHRTLYFGGQHVFKSTNRGDEWHVISPDLTSTPDKPSAVVSIDESPFDPEVLWAGTNDGNVWMTQNGGVDWKKINAGMQGIPEKYWVKRIELSNHEPGRAYVVFDGHRNNDQKPYIFVTGDFGQTWKKMGSSLPDGSVYVVREDVHNADLLFAGTEFAVHMSLDRGITWQKFMNGLPGVPVHDLFIHPRDGDLIAGTHGRGAWIADNITALQQLTKKVLEKEAHLFAVRPEIKFESRNEWEFQTDKEFRAKNPPRGSSIYYYLQSGHERAELEITDLTGEHVFSTLLDTASLKTGINKFQWNFRFNPPKMEKEDLKKFNKRVESAIKTQKEEKPKKEMEELHKVFQETESGAERATVQRRLQRLAGGRAARGLVGFQGGAFAEPGEYLVRLRINGKEMSTMLIIEKDNPGYMGR